MSEFDTIKDPRMRLEFILAATATRFDAVLEGDLANPDRLSRGEWLARAVWESGYRLDDTPQI